MLNKKIMILAIFLVSLLAVSAVSAADNVTSDVVGVDDNDDFYKISDDFRNKTTFGGLVYNINNYTEDGNVYLDKDYKFIGPEYDIDPVSGEQVLIVDDKGITINRSLTIHGNGHTIDADNAAAFFNVNSHNLILKDINFVNGKNNGENSPIIWKGDNGILDNCTFSNVKSDIDGGAINWVGVKGKVTNCNFTDCYAKNAGAILWKGDEGTVLNSNFDNCTPRDNAGSIKWIGSKGTVTGSNFANCHVVKGVGGAIIWEGADGSVDNSNFANLSAESVGHTSGGGAIYWSGENGIISNSNFANTSINWQGGAINWHIVNGIIINCNFLNCTAGGDGGAIYIHSENCSVSNSNFTECNNGAVHLNNVNGTVKNSNFFNCTTDNNGGAIRVSSKNCTVSNSNFANCNSSGYGSAINWAGDYGILTDCTFDNCHAVNHGAVHWTANNATISNSNFTNCYSTSGDGGAVGISGTYKTFVILDSNFINCFSNRHGGAIFWGDGNGNDYTLINSNFFNCSAVREGGAIYGNVKVYDSNFDKCSAEEGGAMFKGSATNCIFTDNKAKWGGAKHSTNDPTVNCTFIGNTASEHAGAVYGNSIINCTFTNNAANSTGGSIQGAQKVLNCNFTNSYANKSGGAIYGAESVTNCNFNNCHALGENGGAVHVNSYGEVIDNCNFADCSSNASGGAVYKNSNAGGVYNSIFINCAAGENGGAVRGANVVNSSFNGNSANKGGALSGGSAKNCTFYGNTAIIEGNNWYETKVPELILNVVNFNSYYDSGDKILLNATEDNIAVNDVIITIRVYKNNTLVKTYDCLSNTEWLVDLDAGSYKADFAVEHDAYKLNKQITLTIDKMHTDVTASDISTIYNKGDVLVVTLKDGNGNPLSGMVIAVDLNGVGNYTTDENGTINVPTTGVVPNNYTAVITFTGTNNYDNSSASVNVTVEKAVPVISSADVTTVYNGGKYLYVTLKDANGNPIVGAKISIDLNGAKSATTGSDGKAKLTTDNLAPKTSYTAKITFAGDGRYTAVSTSAKVKVTKATPKLTVKAKTFKSSDKTKKYTVTLKTNQNKVMKSTKVTINVNKKTYSAKTNAKGVATFKLTKLTKKGKYNAIVKYAGSKYYNSKSVKVKITVK